MLDNYSQSSSNVCKIEQAIFESISTRSSNVRFALNFIEYKILMENYRQCISFTLTLVELSKSKLYYKHTKTTKSYCLNKIKNYATRVIIPLYLTKIRFSGFPQFWLLFPRPSIPFYLYFIRKPKLERADLN